MTNIYLGKDIRLKDGQIQFSQSQDFLVVDDNMNLQQAIFTRLQTVLGELYNTNYGSELYKAVGNIRNELLRGQIIGYISGALYQEPRIKRIDGISINFPEDSPKEVEVTITVIPIESDTPLNLIYPMFL